MWYRPCSNSKAPTFKLIKILDKKNCNRHNIKSKIKSYLMSKRCCQSSTANYSQIETIEKFVKFDVLLIKLFVKFEMLCLEFETVSVSATHSVLRAHLETERRAHLKRSTRFPSWAGILVGYTLEWKLKFVQKFKMSGLQTNCKTQFVGSNLYFQWWTTLIPCITHILVPRKKVLRQTCLSWNRFIFTICKYISVQ